MKVVERIFEKWLRKQVKIDEDKWDLYQKKKKCDILSKTVNEKVLGCKKTTLYGIFRLGKNVSLNA